MLFEGLNAVININEYTRAGFLFFALFFLFRTGLYFIEKVFIKLTSKTKTDLDDIILEKSSKPLNFLSLICALIFSLNQITFEPHVGPVIFKILYSLLTISIGYLIFVIVNLGLIKVWKKLAEKTKSDIDDTIGNLVHETLRILIILILMLLLLNIWGVNIGPFLAGLGIAGLAVALALQPILTNIFSGIAIIADGTFKVGDVIKVDNELGEVYRIGLRTTKIKTFDNEMLIFPNSVVANSKIQNMLQPDLSIRVNVEFGVEYGVDPEYIKKIVIEEIEKIKFINKEEEIRVLFTAMADSSLNFKAMFWVENIANKWPAHQEAISRIYRRLYKENIGIPFPQQTVWLREEGKAKSPSPTDKKFKTVHDKYFPSFGHEYKEKEEEENEEEGKSKEEKKDLFKFGKFKFGKK